MRTMLYAGTISGGSPHDPWVQRSRAYSDPERVKDWLLKENLHKVSQGVWGPRWLSVIEAMDIFSEERIELLRMVVRPKEKLSIIIDVGLRRRRLQESGLQF